VEGVTVLYNCTNQIKKGFETEEAGKVKNRYQNPMIQDIYPRPLHLIGGAHLIKYNTGHWKIDVNCQRKRALISLKIGSRGLFVNLLLCQHPIWASALPGPWSEYCLDRNTNLKVLVPTRMAGPMDAHASG